MMTGLPFRVMAAGTISALLLITPVQADDLELDEVRRLVQNGEILSLAELRDLNQELLVGTLLDVELEEEWGRYVYEFEVLGPDGRVREIYLDASDGRLLKQEFDD